MSTLIDIILPVFMVISFGYGAVWKGYLSESAIDALMKFAINFAVPSLLFLAISRIDIGSVFSSSLFLSYYIGALSGFGAGYLGARYIFGRDAENSIAIGFVGFFSNTLLLGLPIAERAYGPEALSAAYAIISVHALFIYGVGITLMELVRSKKRATSTGLTKTIFSTALSNPLLIAILLGFVANLSGVRLPGVLISGLETMASAALPVALFGLGGLLVRYRPEGDKYAIAWITSVSLIVHPAVTYMLGAWVFDLTDAQLQASVLLASMAPGVNAFLFATMYGVAMRVAASSVLVATGLSIFSIWVWLAILP